MQREKTRDIARGKWAGLLGQWLDERALKGRHTACPMCGGRDRFRFDDKGGDGTWICSNCGAGDGFHLLQNLNNWTFSESATFVEQKAGRVQARQVVEQRDVEDARKTLRRVWSEGVAVKDGDPVSMYLRRRCAVTAVPSCLRFHESLEYLHDSGKVTNHPAMLAQVCGQDGKGVTIHRTYLTSDGNKANLEPARKLMTGTVKLSNVAVRLAEPDHGYLGIAEGIETALCASRRFRVPVWAGISAVFMKSFCPPPSVTMLAIYGDHDQSFTGQAAAYELARALTVKGIECTVTIPDVPGHDWADVA